MSVNSHVAKMLRDLADLLEEQDAAPELDLKGLLGNLAGAMPPGMMPPGFPPPGFPPPGFPPGAPGEAEGMTAPGPLYPSEDHEGDGMPPTADLPPFMTPAAELQAKADAALAEHRGTQASVNVVQFDPDDLPLDRYEDCLEKQKQTDEPARRQELRDDPLKWMTVAAYYANLLTIPAQQDHEEVARCILMLPGGSHRRLKAVQALDGGVFMGDRDAPEFKHQREYDDLWIECYAHIYTAHHPAAVEPTGDAQFPDGVVPDLDAVDYAALLLKLGEPAHGGTWRIVERKLGLAEAVE
ncbi:MAG: hypothetical protein ACYTGE_11235 [Planctomycetota bacterium]|jgi:hypothetical protein